MGRYTVGDKVKTVDEWNNGMGIIIPAGSIVTVEYDSGERARCSFNGFDALYEYAWLGEVVTLSQNEIIDKFVNKVTEQLIDLDGENGSVSVNTCIDIVSDVGKQLKNGAESTKVSTSGDKKVIKKLETLIDEIWDGKCVKVSNCPAWNCTDCYKERMQHIIYNKED